MIRDLIFMNGYGVFVWSAFTITFFSCAILYYRTYKTLKKYEKEFANEIKELTVEERKIVIKNSKVASQILSSYNNKTI